MSWKRVRGWAEYKKGHGNTKVPATRLLDANPGCRCGCGEPVSWRHGQGWHHFKRGHRARLKP